MLKAKCKWFVSFTLILFMMSTLTCAVDNPDLPDTVGAFELREKPFLVSVNNPDNGYRASLLAYNDYLIFLDQELNAAYSELKFKLPESAKKQLKDSQLNWLKYRDLEFELISSTWTRIGYGSSAGIIRGNYRASIVRDRVIQLIYYSKGY